MGKCAESWGKVREEEERKGGWVGGKARARRWGREDEEEETEGLGFFFTITGQGYAAWDWRYKCG